MSYFTPKQDYHGELLTETSTTWTHPNPGQAIAVDVFLASGGGGGSGTKNSAVTYGGIGGNTYIVDADQTTLLTTRGGDNGRGTPITGNGYSGLYYSSLALTANWRLPFGTRLRRYVSRGGRYADLTQTGQVLGEDGEICRMRIVTTGDLSIYVGAGGAGGFGDYAQYRGKPGEAGAAYLVW